ncbi:DUF2802 domain-containing protein [Shewanella sp. NFH-SH190041]|nr:DUF2802 domain-containing protein [Shewanella sp. NFH-SH190041]BDM63826.1 DUF2802 domain-containing protein [Shewanella sp. NFH-SH190041]
MTNDIILFIALVLCSVAIASTMGFSLYRMWQQLRALKVLIREFDRQRELLQQELTELRSGTVGIGRRVLTMEKSLQQQQERIEEQVEQDSGSKLYSRANKMIELGADMEELIRECELPRAEAELLMRLRQKG